MERQDMNKLPTVKEYHLAAEDSCFNFLTDNMIKPHPVQTSEIYFHTHKMNELFFVTKGSLEMRTPTSREVLNVGDLAVVPSELLHGTRVLEETYYMNIMFEVKAVKKNTEAGYVKQFSELLNKDRFVIIPNFDTMGCFKRLRIYQNHIYTDCDQLTTACLHEIIFLLKNALVQSEDKGLGQMTLENISYRDFIIDQYMNSYMEQHITLTELAGILHISVQQLQRIIKKLYDQSFSERIVYLKMQNAKRLIRETDLTMGKIAGMAGYASQYSFFAAFKKQCGMTPSQYRKSVAEEMEE